MNLTERQKEVLAFIKSFLKRNGYPPTRSEISENFKWESITAATTHIHALQRKGAITVAAGISRGIAIVK